MADLLQFPSILDDSQRSQETATGAPPDLDIRRRALDITRSCIVEAPAGSGKTGLLIQRFLKLLASGIEQPEEVLAITFTRKATAELRERILYHLDAASQSDPLAEDASPFERETRELAEAVLAADALLHWQLLAQPQRLRILTIDALCAEIVRTLPILSGSGGLGSPVEKAEPLYREAARRTLLCLGGQDAALNDALTTVLLHRDVRIDDCERLLARMLQQREQWAELVPLDTASLTEESLEDEVRPRLERALESIVCAALTRALDAFPAHLLSSLAAVTARLAFEPGYNGNLSPLEFCVDHQLPPNASAENLNHWVAFAHLLLTKEGKWRSQLTPKYLGFEPSEKNKQLLKDVISALRSQPGSESLREALHALCDLPPARYPDDQWQVAKALFRLLRHALAELKALFGETGQCDFTELSLAARHALASGSGAADLALSAGARLTHLLLDEMQDTSSAQYHLLELLTRSWDGHSQTLFLVGDPKQSIYLFRQARVERFLRTVRERQLGEIPLEALQLTANFRSQHHLVAGFNETFSQLFPASHEASGGALDVPFVAADPVRTPGSAAAIRWHSAVLDDYQPIGQPELSPADLRKLHAQAEARALRRIVEDWRARPLPAGRRTKANGKPEPWKIAILARSRSQLTAIVAELNAHAIPYRAVNIDPLAERPEVLDALALTRALLHPADRTAWLAVLHAPWCGLALADLLTLTGEGSAADAEATVPELIAGRALLLSAEGQRLLDRAWPSLSTALETAGRTSFAVHVERTWRSLGGDAPLTPEQQANVRRFFEIVHALEAETGRVDLSALTARLEDLHAESAPGDDAVEILTIHGSKGLEWDLVLVPGLDRGAPQTSSELLNWLELDEGSADTAHILLAPIHARGADSGKLNKWLHKLRAQREAAERKRLFYVACTRAKEELHLFGLAGRTKAGDALKKPRHTSLLHACWPAAEAHFTAQNPVTVPLPTDLKQAIAFDVHEDAQPLALAAAAEAAPNGVAGSRTKPPILHRLPLDFNPLARFDVPAGARLPYIPASALAVTQPFDRPEGSFAVRAFGNVVHRFLALCSAELESGKPASTLLNDLASWEPRLAASLRGEGLAPALAQRDAARALLALRNTLTDPTGLWILSPHPQATSERSLTTSARTLRADRTFLAGADPLSAGTSHIWIVDFKTTDPGSRPRDAFRAQEIAKYRGQLESYARIRREVEADPPLIRLGLFYPFLPGLLDWASDTLLTPEERTIS